MLDRVFSGDRFRAGIVPCCFFLAAVFRSGRLREKPLAVRPRRSAPCRDRSTEKTAQRSRTGARGSLMFPLQERRPRTVCAQSAARERGLSAHGDSIDKGVPGRGGSRGEETVAGEGRALVRSIPARCGTGASIQRLCAGTKPRGFSLSRLLLAVLSGPQSAR